MKANVLFRSLALLLILVMGAVLPVAAAPLQLVSLNDPAFAPSPAGSGDSWQPILTPDGRYVLFASRANNLVRSGTNSPFLNQEPPKLNVYLRDRLQGTTTLVSINQSGTGPGNGDSIPTGLSTNGQFALFESNASDLAPGDTNQATDIFLRDVVNGTNQLVSVSTNGGFGNGASWESSLTPDGHYAVFASAASNLVPRDTNGIQDIFVRDVWAGVTTLASPGATATVSPASSDSPQITPDGRYVVFRSSATGLAWPSTAVINEIYVRDLAAGVTTLVSTNAHILFKGTPSSYNQVISDDGQYVVFESSVNNSAGILQRYSLPTGFTDLIYTNAYAPYSCNHFRSVDMTPDSRYVAFAGIPQTGGTNSYLYVWDSILGTTTLESTNLNGTAPATSFVDWPTLDASGRWVAFVGMAANLTTNIVDGNYHLYVKDLQAGVTTLVDAGPGLSHDILTAPDLTPDGTQVAYDAEVSPTANDPNQTYQVFVGNVSAGTSELISVRQPSLPSQTPGGATLAPVYSQSTSGRFLAFSGTGAGLLAGGYTNAGRGVFVRDQLYGINALASVDTNGLAEADGSSFEPSLSGDGSYVVFTSSADNLVPGDTNQVQDVFLRNLTNGVTTLVSLNAAGNGEGNAASYSPTISTNGRYVLFHSKASNLTSGTFNGTDNLFLRDLQLGTNYWITTNSPGYEGIAMTPDLRFIAYGGATHNLVLWDTLATSWVYTLVTTLPVSTVAVSPNGNRFVYSLSTGFYAEDRSANSNWLIGTTLNQSVSHVTMQFTADSRYLVYSSSVAGTNTDTNRMADVYLYDFQTRNNLLISHALNGSGSGNGPSDSPVISPDGSYIAYRSSASNLVAGATNGQPQIILYNYQTGTQTLVSASAFGAFGGNNRSLLPQFSGDSQTLVFQSWAADLAALDFNQSASLYSLRVAPDSTSPPFLGQIAFAPAPLRNPVLTWPATTGQNYQVQFKNNLNDPVWQR